MTSCRSTEARCDYWGLSQRAADAKLAAFREANQAPRASVESIGIEDVEKHVARRLGDVAQTLHEHKEHAAAVRKAPRAPPARPRAQHTARVVAIAVGIWGTAAGCNLELIPGREAFG